MKIRKDSLMIIALGLVFASAARADSTTSYTGTLSSSTDTFTTTFTLAGNSTVDLQTWGFGGGTNAAGKSIAAGGFDPLLALFSGTGSSATLLTDGVGNPFATSDTLSNFSSFVGCPPGKTVNIGGAVCSDISMALALGKGTYTVLLSDANYIPNAIFDNGTFGEGFTDLTGGAFQTCNTGLTGATTCASDTGNWAFDLTTKSGVVTTPEPTSLALLATGLAALALRRRSHSGQNIREGKSE